MNPTLRDKRAGQRLAFFGGRRILHEAERAPTNRERIARWRVAYARVPIEMTLKRTARP